MRPESTVHRVLLACVVLLCAAVLVAALMRPSFLLVHLAGYSCSRDGVCSDDPEHLPEAVALYAAALQHLDTHLAPLTSAPVALFCHTARCYTFGFGDGSAAKSIGSYLIVISPRGWQPHFVRHELIHRLQAQTLGVIGMYRRPQWYLEGMAYDLSEDPRERLAEPFEAYRNRFRDWYAGVGARNIWSSPTGP